MIVKISSHRMGKVAFTFDNGNRLSIIFDGFSYSDNSNIRPFPEPAEYESTTVEIMATSGSEAFALWLSKHYGDNPAACVPVAEIPRVMKRADSRQYKGNDLAASDRNANTGVANPQPKPLKKGSE